jgi:transcription antitermination protein NusB
LGIHELRRGEVPPKVAIDEAIHLAHWFGDVRAPGFVNGILDGVARSLGRL